MEDPSSQESSSLPNAARVRDNQRRSRARRKEYVQELEAKVRHYENQGVQAAKEIQDAARVVLEENRALKAELQELKRLREVDEQSTRSTPTSAGFPTHAAEVANEGLATQELLRDTSLMGMSEKSSTATNHATRKTQSAFAPNITQSSPHNTTASTKPSERHVTARAANEQHLDEKTLTACSLNKHSTISHRQGRRGEQTHTWTEELDMSNDRSSCAFAVSILTSMRADITAEDVQAELGCNTEFDRCSVDNSKLFVAVDRFT